MTIFGGVLVEAASRLAQWQCFIGNMTGDSIVHSGPSARGGGGGSPSARLCSTLLRLVSLALTTAKAVARRSGRSSLLLSASFELWESCSAATLLFGLPQRMQADQGITALLLNPACCGIQRAMSAVDLADHPHQTAISGDAVSSLLTLLQSCSHSLPPRLAVDVLMAGPALALIEQEAGRLLPQAPVSTAAVGYIHPPQADDYADLDDLAATTARYVASLMMNLACAVFGVPAAIAVTQQNADATARQMMWLSVARDPSGCREGHSLQDGKPFFSAAFQSETAPASATAELLAEESVTALSRILSSPVWDRVIGYNSGDSACSWLAHVTSGLCCAASILELHPAVRQHSSLTGSSIGGSTPGGGSAEFAATAALLAMLPSGLLSQWSDARHNVAWALRLLSATGNSRAILAGALHDALSQVRDVLSGIVSQAAAGIEDGLGTAAAHPVTAAAVTNQNSTGGCSLGMRDWECVQCELLLGLPEELWGVHPCCNTACVRLEGPCEMEVKTQACGGGCGARYCCVACQEQAWRGGHQRNCAAMREMRGRSESTDNDSQSVSTEGGPLLLPLNYRYKA